MTYKRLKAIGRVFLAVLLPVSSAHASYRLECAEVYNAPCSGSALPNSCNNTDGFEDAAPSSWTLRGYYANQFAWPIDWIDEAVGGDDYEWADESVVSIWSGHGTGGAEPNQSWDIAFGNNTTGQCYATAGGFSSQIRLGDVGESGPDWGLNRLAVFDASCSAVVGEWASVYAGCADGPGMMYHSTQALGFSNSPSDSPDRLFIFGTLLSNGNTIKSAWLTAGGGCFGLFCDDESPVVMTKGNNQTDATNRANTLKASNILTGNRPACDGYYWMFRDSGGGSC